jgi:hypothetical protein
MLREFRRYGLEKFRMLTGFLELLGGAGTLVGFIYSPAFLISTAGLGLLMFLGFLVRIRVRDPWAQMLPAIILMLINLFLFSDRLLANLSSPIHIDFLP